LETMYSDWRFYGFLHSHQHHFTGYLSDAKYDRLL
jgi:hypothetical protein